MLPLALAFSYAAIGGHVGHLIVDMSPDRRPVEDQEGNRQREVPVGHLITSHDVDGSRSGDQVTKGKRLLVT
jgi:hypothetical protein